MSALVCPRCDRGDGLSTTERLSGDAAIVEVTIAPNGTRDFMWAGETKVDWDSSTTVGANCCYCGWFYEGDDWLDQLAVEPERCALCGEAVEQRGPTLVHRATGNPTCHDADDVATYTEQVAVAAPRA